jgi:hypothetical protein
MKTWKAFREGAREITVKRQKHVLRRVLEAEVEGGKEDNKRRRQVRRLSQQR